MKQLLHLALAADIVALMTVVLGSWTRINGAGLTCPDWPLCHGRLVPPMTGGTLWEWTHRLLAFAVAPLVVALVVAAWRKRDRPFIGPTLAVIAALFLTQVFLGAETVRLANTPISVVLHWATAMALIAALSAMAVFAAASGAAPSENSARSFSAAFAILSATAIVAFATMCVGAYVSSSGAGLACLSIPDCAGNVVVYTSGQFVQMLHRIAAAVTLICSVGALAIVWAQSSSLRLRAAVSLGVALVSVQVLLGLLNVALRLPTDLREAHAVNAALVFLTFFVAATFAGLDTGPAVDARRLRESGLPR
jgi:heme A synthase